MAITIGPDPKFQLNGTSEIPECAAIVPWHAAKRFQRNGRCMRSAAPKRVSTVSPGWKPSFS
jgi:hypothetical protein